MTYNNTYVCMSFFTSNTGKSTNKYQQISQNQDRLPPWSFGHSSKSESDFQSLRDLSPVTLVTFSVWQLSSCAENAPPLHPVV
jgi:hypothetical protein